MSGPDLILIAELANLLKETAHRHHRAYADGDGADPNWPLWYASDLQARLWDRLGRLLTRSEWVYLLVDADRAAAQRGVTDWPPFYARRIQTYATRVGSPTSGDPDLLFPRLPDPVPFVTADQMREVDRLMVEVFGIELLQMMEHAGRAVAQVARKVFFGGDVRGRRVVVLAGTGGNGGGALVAARLLHNAGADVEVWATRPDKYYNGVPAHQIGILRTLGVAATSGDIAPSTADLVVDGLLGYSLEGAPNGAAAERIRWANGQPAPILSLDLPSGLDATTGRAFDPHIVAATTVTLALPKTGLKEGDGPSVAGSVYLADISVPRELYSRMGLPSKPLLSAGDILRI